MKFKFTKIQKGGGYLNNKKITPKKSLVIGITLGILVGGIGAGAATYFSANQVSYTPSDETWDVSNVQEAIDNLYSISSGSSSFELSSNSSYGHERFNSNSVELSLNQGDYVCVSIFSLSTSTNTASFYVSPYSPSAYTVTGCDNYELIKEPGTLVGSANKFDVSNYYLTNLTMIKYFKCNLSSDNTIISTLEASSAPNNAWQAHILCHSI